TPFASEEAKRIGRVLLPMGTFAETSGTYVNCEGLWQSQPGAAAPVGEARPGWKVLRVLGNLLGLEGFDYQSSEDVLREVREACAGVKPAGYQGSHAVPRAEPRAALRGRAGTRSALRRRAQAAAEGSRSPGQFRQVPVPPRARDRAGAGIGRLGGDPAVARGGGVEGRRGAPLPSFPHL